MKEILELLDAMLANTIEQLETHLTYRQDLSDQDQYSLQDYIDNLESERYDVNEFIEELACKPQ